MKKLRALYLISFTIILALSSCRPRFLELSSQQTPVQIYKAERGYLVGSPVWLSDTVVVFAYSPISKSGQSNLTTPDLRLYDIHQMKWEKISMILNEDCKVVNFSYLQRLPDQQLGFYNTCLSNRGNIRSIIQEMNIATGKAQTLVEYDPEISAGKFSFSPDMSELIQEDKTGRFLSNKLFYKRGDTKIQIVPDFTRAMYPDWSPLSREIAFWGTESYPDGNPEDFKTLPEISALALYPFDLYISSPEGTNLKRILPTVKDPLFIKWSPKERIIAFAGSFDGMPGIWLVDPSTAEATRIWSTSGDFDWSPDGNQIVIVDSEKNQEGMITDQKINIISVK